VDDFNYLIILPASNVKVRFHEYDFIRGSTPNLISLFLKMPRPADSDILNYLPRYFVNNKPIPPYVEIQKIIEEYFENPILMDDHLALLFGSTYLIYQ